MPAADTIPTDEASFEQELVDLLRTEQEWVDAVFEEIIGPLAAKHVTVPAPGGEDARRGVSVLAPMSRTPRRPSEMERSPPLPEK